MPQNNEDYCRRLQTEADIFARKAEGSGRFQHLRAFNFGRSVARLEHARDVFWMRVRWLLLGAAVGVTLAAVYVQVFVSPQVFLWAK